MKTNFSVLHRILFCLIPAVLCSCVIPVFSPSIPFSEKQGDPLKLIVYGKEKKSGSVVFNHWIVLDEKTHKTIERWAESAVRYGFVNIVTWVPQVILKGKNFNVTFNSNVTIVNYTSDTFGAMSYQRNPTALDKEIREKLYSFAFGPYEDIGTDNKEPAAQNTGTK